MIKSKIRAVVAAMAIVVAPGVVSAGTEVVGQVTANPSAIINVGSVSTRIGAEQVPYIQGDQVTTAADSTATVNLTSGKASFVVAPNTVMQVVDSTHGEVAIDKGAVQFSAAQDFPVSFTTSAGTFTVSADAAIDAVAVVEGGNFAVASKSGSLLVNSQNGVVSEVAAGEAFTFDGEARVVDVQLLTGFTFLGLSGGAAIGAVIGAVVAGGVIINEVTDDDDDNNDNASPR